jgi:hypothetical protein
MRVIDEQAAVFAGYKCEGSGTVWYNVDPKMAEKLCSCGERMDEFAWLRDLALDHADLTAALAACEDDYAAARCGKCRSATWMSTGRSWLSTGRSW